MTLTARQAQLLQLNTDISLNEELRTILEKIEETGKTQGSYTHVGVLQQTTIQALSKLGYAVIISERDGTRSYNIKWDIAPVDESYTNMLRFSSIDEKFETNTNKVMKAQKLTIILCIIIIILLLLMSGVTYIINRTQQVGLIALIDVPNNSLDIPDYDPDSIITPDDDPVSKLNEKLDKGKMCINMISKVTLDDAYSVGYFNIVNDEINNYPQFVTLMLDSNNTTIYQSGLIDVGKCIKYARIDVALPAGEYDCTAVFSQVDTATNKICGQAAAKVKLIIKS